MTIRKFDFFLFSDFFSFRTLVNFGNVEKGQSAKRQVRLFNPSNVSAQILIEDGTKADSVVPSDLVCPMQKAELGPGCTMMLPLLFKPLLGSNITIKRTVRVSCIQERHQNSKLKK